MEKTERRGKNSTELEQPNIEEMELLEKKEQKPKIVHRTEQADKKLLFTISHRKAQQTL